MRKAAVVCVLVSLVLSGCGEVALLSGTGSGAGTSGTGTGSGSSGTGTSGTGTGSGTRTSVDYPSFTDNLPPGGSDGADSVPADAGLEDIYVIGTGTRQAARVRRSWRLWPWAASSRSTAALCPLPSFRSLVRS
jgi:hypothetical protein